jgi:hydrogenase nickel incorporation protein HypA/HybF
VHEFGLCEAVIEAVERRAAGRTVLGVRVRIGARHRVDEAAFDQAFGMVSLGTVADGAEVEWIVVPVRFECRSCGHQGETTDPWATCARCGGADLDLSGGDDLILESIEVSKPSPERVTSDGAARVAEGAVMGTEGAADDVRKAAEKAFEGRETQDASKSEEGAVYAPEKGVEKVGESITEGGEERGAKHTEPGRVMDESDTGEKDSAGHARPAGKSDARMSTSVDPQNPIEEESPELQSGDQGG